MCSGLVGVLRPAASLVVWHSRSGFGLPRCLASGECDIGWSACWGAPLRDKWGGEGGLGAWLSAFYTYGRTACVLAGLCGVGDFVRANNTLWLQPGSVPAVFVGLQWVRAL